MLRMPERNLSTAFGNDYQRLVFELSRWELLCYSRFAKCDRDLFSWFILCDVCGKLFELSHGQLLPRRCVHYSVRAWDLLRFDGPISGDGLPRGFILHGRL